jgi:branched-subunit amino acid ABC-type transport system permease component
VKAITALCLVAAITSVGFVVLILAGGMPLSAGAFLLGGGLEQLGPVAFLLYAALLFLLAVALWRRWRWARRIAILVAVVGIFLAIQPLSSAVMDSRIFAIAREGVQIIVRVLIVFYLSQEPVKDWFAPR